MFTNWNESAKVLTAYRYTLIIKTGGFIIGTSQTRASNKYQKKSYKRYSLIVRKDSQKNIIDHLDKQESVNGYIIKLIEKDMN